jgi:hypothetical protein
MALAFTRESQASKLLCFAVLLSRPAFRDAVASHLRVWRGRRMRASLSRRTETVSRLQAVSAKCRLGALIMALLSLRLVASHQEPTLDGSSWTNMSCAVRLDGERRYVRSLVTWSPVLTVGVVMMRKPPRWPFADELAPSVVGWSGKSAGQLTALAAEPRLERCLGQSGLLSLTGYRCDDPRCQRTVFGELGSIQRCPPGS